VLGLTSLPLLIVLMALAAALLGGVVVGWPLLAGAGARRIAMRTVALCALHATVLLLAFVVVNRINVFYSSWSDLFGQYRGGGTLVNLPERHGTVRTSALVSVQSSRSVRLPGRPRPAGSLQTVNISGQMSGLAVAGHVYLPPGYGRAARHGKPYPVIVAISGSPRSRTSASGAQQLALTAATQIAAGRLQPLILVTLPAGVRSDPGCLDVPGGPQAALFFGQDVPTAIGSAYHASRQRSGWALLGDAAGGYCALQLAMTNAATFSAAAVPPGRYNGPPGPRRPATWGRSREIRSQDNLTWLLTHQPMQPISLLLFGPGQADVFRALARPPMQVASASRATGPRPLAPAVNWLGRELRSGGNHV
jgi:enterochelin esterase-like enzyme